MPRINFFQIEFYKKMKKSNFWLFIKMHNNFLIAALNAQHATTLDEILFPTFLISFLPFPGLIFFLFEIFF